ncbi:MAG: PASTA domain-containing protein [Buchananella hordeovulneris]|nr:PASTA domain-containing protein [Buchananella hordeovulneris]
MPDLYGLDEQAVMLVLQDHELADVEVKKEERPAPGESGLVMEQKPAAGSEIDGVKTVSIVLTAPMDTPDFVGKPSGEAIKTLEGMGIFVRIKRTVTGEKAPGTVLGTTPKAGEALTAEVTVEIADPGESIYVGATNTIRDRDGYCGFSTGDIKAGGVKVQVYGYCEGGKDVSRIHLTPGRKASLLQFEVAISDESKGASANVKVYADGHVIKELTVERGKTEPVTLQIDSAFDLTVEVTGPERTVVVFGGMRYAAEPQNLGDLQ